jgi:hypothetical protein
MHESKEVSWVVFERLRQRDKEGRDEILLNQVSTRVSLAAAASAFK